MSEHTAKSVEELNREFGLWVNWYNTKHRIRTIDQIPEERVTPNGWTPLLPKEDLDRIFSYKDTRKVDKNHQFGYEGKTYTLPKEPCLVAFRINVETTPETIHCYWQDQMVAIFNR